MRLRCNLCVEQKRDEASRKTDVLWLRTIKSRDFLVCRYHRTKGEDHRGYHGQSNSKRTVSRVSS